MAPGRSKRPSAATAASTPSEVGSESGSIHTAPPLKKKKVVVTPLKGDRQAMETFFNTTMIQGGPAATRVMCGVDPCAGSSSSTPIVAPADAQSASSVIPCSEPPDDDESVWRGSASFGRDVMSDEDAATAATLVGEDSQNAPLSELHSSASAECARELMNAKLDLSTADGQVQLQSLIQSFAKPIIADHAQATSSRMTPKMAAKEQILSDALHYGELDPRSSVGQDFYRATKKRGPLHQAL